MGHLILKFTSLLAFLGGPLYVADQLKPALGQQGSFALVFAPVGLVMFAALTMSDEEPAGAARIAVVGGVLGAFILLGLNGYTAWQISHGSTHPEARLIGGGIVVGVVACGLFLTRAQRYLSS